ncbi:MAG TPA: leucyl aminopeptidase [Chloroflexi bacterium]|nr:leucyl aminopeptidase [Chloroflexota bacterium]
MKIEVTDTTLKDLQTPMIALGITQDTQPRLAGLAAEVDAALTGQISAILEAGDFRGKPNETLVLYTHGAIPTPRVLLVGLGKLEEITYDVIREVAATATTRAQELGLNALHIPLLYVDKLDTLRVAEVIAEGSILAQYRYQELKTEAGEEDQPTELDNLTVLARPGEHLPEIEAAVKAGEIIAQSTNLARDLINRPANLATPSEIASVARSLSKGTALRCHVLDAEEMEHLGMHLLLSVNQGSQEPAKLVVLEYNADRRDLPTIVLVGKGITFDSGGISLKPSQNMDRMKGDMAGAAAVIAALRAAALLELPLHVVGLTPLTDNMPDARATKPGDVIRSMKGLTVEIISTDAEGRLVLADALTYAGEFEPDAIFDIATLTGGRVIALGAHAAAVMGADPLIERLRRAGEYVAERVWPLPLFQEYGKQLESEVADLKNVGGREASTITGGFFLSRFVPDGVPWVHIDIAGLALVDKSRPYIPKGGTGFGARLLIETLRSWQTRE